MTEQSTTPAGTTATPSQVFHRPDYARFAGVIRRARAVKGTAGHYYPEPKSPAEQAVIDEMAEVIAAGLEADAATGSEGFSREVWLNSTRLRAKPQGYDVGADGTDDPTMYEDDEDDEDDEGSDTL